MKLLLNFDYDGVIVDSLQQLTGFAARAQQQLGLGRPPTGADWETIESLTFPGLGKVIGIPESSISEFTDIIFDLQAKAAPPPVFPDLPGVLRELSDSHCMVVVTASLASAVQATLSANSLEDAFQDVLGGELVCSKSERIARAQRQFEFESTQTVMIGDAISDIREGKQAGVVTIAVGWGFQASELLLGEQPDFFADEPGDLLAIAANFGRDCK